VLVLVLEHHLDQRGVAAVEHRKGALPNTVEEGDRLVEPQVGKPAATSSRRLRGVVDAGQLGVQGSQAGPAAEPQLLEGGYVAEVPDQRAVERVVDRVTE
jgi:hypothetical protein